MSRMHFHGTQNQLLQISRQIRLEQRIKERNASNLPVHLAQNKNNNAFPKPELTICQQCSSVHQNHKTNQSTQSKTSAKEFGSSSSSKMQTFCLALHSVRDHFTGTITSTHTNQQQHRGTPIPKASKRHSKAKPDAMHAGARNSLCFCVCVCKATKTLELRTRESFEERNDPEIHIYIKKTTTTTTRTTLIEFKWHNSSQLCHRHKSRKAFHLAFYFSHIKNIFQKTKRRQKRN